MKSSAAGDDEVNILMIRQAAPEVREEVYNIIQKMFLGETPWDPVTTRAVVVLLWKKRAREPTWTSTEVYLFEYMLQDFGPCLGKAVVGGGRKVWLVVNDSVGFQVGPQRCGCGHDFPNLRRGAATREPT